MDALVLNLETRAGLFLTRWLGRAGYRVASGTWETRADAPGMRSRYAAARVVLPDPNDGVGHTARHLAEFLAANRVDVVIPSTESALVSLHEHRELLGSLTQIAVGSAPAVEGALSKTATLDLCRELGIDVPHTIRVTGGRDLGAAVAEVGFPAVLKPERAWRRVGGYGEWVKGQVLLHREDVERAEELVGPDRPALVQEYVSGVRESQLRFRDRGCDRLRAALLVERMWPEIGVSVMRRTISPPDDTGLAADRLVAALGLDGFSHIEFRRDAAGRPRLMEINPRPVVGPVEALTRAGVDLPRMIVEWARGGRVSNVAGYELGVRVGWLGGDIRRLAAAWRIIDATPRPGAARVLREIVGDYVLGRAEVEGLDLRDLRPLAMSAIESARAVCRRVLPSR